MNETCSHCLRGLVIGKGELCTYCNGTGFEQNFAEKVAPKVEPKVEKTAKQEFVEKITKAASKKK